MWLPTHKHLKTGKFYRYLGKGIHTETGEEVAIYENDLGDGFCRPIAMFNEVDRFQPITYPEVRDLREEGGSLLGFYVDGHVDFIQFCNLVNAFTGADPSYDERYARHETCFHTWWRVVPNGDGWSRFVVADRPGRGAKAVTVTEHISDERYKKTCQDIKRQEESRRRGHREGLSWALDWLHSRDIDMYREMTNEWKERSRVLG